MAKDPQSMARDQDRPSSETGRTGSGQHGSPPGQHGSSGQQTAWQRPSSGQQGSGAGLQGSRAGMPASPRDEGALSPFSMLRRMREDMDRLFEGFWRHSPMQFAQPWTGEAARGLWNPHVDVREHDGMLSIAADLPGVKSDEVNVEITPEAVTIQGERRQESTQEERGYYRSERSYGSFYRTIPLPEGADTENASATLRDGVLRIDIRVPERQSKPRKLEVRGS
jgi:HSP20 family protein